RLTVYTVPGTSGGTIIVGETWPSLSSTIPSRASTPTRIDSAATGDPIAFAEMALCSAGGTAADATEPALAAGFCVGRVSTWSWLDTESITAMPCAVAPIMLVRTIGVCDPNAGRAPVAGR